MKCGCDQPTVSGCKPYYGWHDPEGKYEGWTDEEREADWLRRLAIAQENTRKIVAKTTKPKDKKDE